MTQGLHFSMLMTGADTALLADPVSAESGASDEGSADSGILFGSMLGELVQAEKNGLSNKTRRQLPADISLLSGVSQAIAAATDGAAAPQADAGQDSALTQSILAQLALNGTASVGLAAQHAEAANISTEHNDDAGGNNASQASAATDSESDAKTADSLVAKLGAEVNKPGAEVNKPGAEVNPEGSGAATNTATADDTADKASPTAAATGPVNVVSADKLATADITAPAQEATAKTPLSDTAQQLKTAKASAADNSSSTSAAQALAQQQRTADALSIDAAKAGQLEGEPLPAGLAPANRNAADEAAQSKIKDDSVKSVLTLAPEITDHRYSPGIMSHAAVADGEGQATVNNNAGDKVSAWASKVTAPGSEKAAAANTGSTGGSEQGTQQQSQRQQSGTMLPEFTLDAAALANKQADSNNTLQRIESPFAQALQQVEQRQQTKAAKAASPAMAEQLKQSLNLLQQDSPAQLQQRVNLMLRQNIQVAEIRLDPAGLGQMQIKIDMQQDQASVQFVVQQPQAKELLEQQLPRLRELLQQQGIVLGEGSVQQQSQQQERQLAQHGRSGNQQGGSMDDSSDDLPSAAVQVTAAVSERLVDYYA